MDALDALKTQIKGAILLFFPGSREGNSYRFLGSREGWDYLATPILADRIMNRENPAGIPEELRSGTGRSLDRVGISRGAVEQLAQILQLDCSGRRLGPGSGALWAGPVLYSSRGSWAPPRRL
jgi:hypothetical protein